MQKIPVRKIATAAIPRVAAGSFSIRPLQTLLAGNKMEQPLHRHDFYFLLIVIKGKGTHSIDFADHVVGDRMVFLLHPGQVHALTLSASTTGYLIQFDTSFYIPDTALPLQPQQPCFTFRYKALQTTFSKLIALTHYLQEEYLHKRPQHEKVIRSLLDVFFITLMRDQAPQQTPHSSLYQQQQLNAFLSLIEKNLHRPTTVSEYASLLHLSLFQLNAVTKATLHKTASAVIHDRILLEAKRYLLATSLQVIQIADLLGYEDVAYFIRFFKKHNGLTPEAFRQQLK